MNGISVALLRPLVELMGRLEIDAEAVLTGAGHFAAICDHGKGHKIPLDAAPSIAAFFTAHGFGVWPSPYTSGLPATFPAYCAR